MAEDLGKSMDQEMRTKQMVDAREAALFAVLQGIEAEAARIKDDPEHTQWNLTSLRESLQALEGTGAQK